MRKVEMPRIVLGALLGVLACAGDLSAADTILTVVTGGAAYAESRQPGYRDPYTALHPDVEIRKIESPADAPDALRAQSAAGRVGWDLVHMLPSDAAPLCEEGVLLEIDPDTMLASAPDGTPASLDFQPGSLGNCFVAAGVHATTIAFNRTMFPPDRQPGSIADFFDVESFPGRRALRDRPVANLEWALYADGVPPGEIYDVLATPEGVDRALARLGSIKDHLVFWTEDGQPAELLDRKAVAFASADTDRLLQLAEVERRPIGIIQDGQVLEWQGWVVPAQGRNLEAVIDYLAWLTDTRHLADQAGPAPFGPARRSSAPPASTDADRAIATGPQVSVSPDDQPASLALDAHFWAARGDDYRERYSTWMRR